MFKNGHINITGFQILARESIEYDYLKRFIHQMAYEQQLDDAPREEEADLQVCFYGELKLCKCFG
jgi:hypothetical protein